MSKTDFLKQAIADATEIQRSSVELAKKSLSEAFDSQLKSMLAAKLQEEAEEMDEEIAEEDDLAHEAFDETLEEEKDSDDMDSKEPPMEEEYDLDEILAEMEGEDDEDESEEKENVDEAKEEDEDTEEQEEHEKSESDEEEKEEEVDEEFNLEALLRELSMSEESEEAPEASEEAPEETEDDEVKKMEEQLFELKNKLNEVNLLNAKLLYLNKVLAENDSLTANQKVKLISTFDEASSVKEVKLVHKTITEAFKVKQNSTKKVTQLKESVKSFASNPAGDSKKMDKEIDTNPLSSLWQRIKKY